MVPSQIDFGQSLFRLLTLLHHFMMNASLLRGSDMDRSLALLRCSGLYRGGPDSHSGGDVRCGPPESTSSLQRTDIILYLARMVGLRLPSISFHWPRGRPGRATPTDPRTCAERWVHELEGEIDAEFSYTAYAHASSSSLSNRVSGPSRHRLPEFLLMSYDEAVRKAKEDLKVLMIILVSQEHDAVPHFKRLVL